MLGHAVCVAGGVFVAGGVEVVAVRLVALLDADVDEPPAACAITKPPIADPASRPAESMAVAAILRKPDPRRAGSAGGEGGGLNCSPSIGVYLLVVD